MSGTRDSSPARFLVSPRWLCWHLFVIASVLAMLWLGAWQLRRAESGNSLSWAYTFEWPLFAVFAVYFWVKTIRDEIHPPASAGDSLELPDGAAESVSAALRAAGGEAPAADAELAPHHAYLARLTKEVAGHGRWHGFR